MHLARAFPLTYRQLFSMHRARFEPFSARQLFCTQAVRFAPLSELQPVGAGAGGRTGWVGVPGAGGGRGRGGTVIRNKRVLSVLKPSSSVTRSLTFSEAGVV